MHKVSAKLQIAKPKHKRHKPPLEIPAKIRQAVSERDKHICQICGDKGIHLHHIVLGGIGRRRVHAIENIITLCNSCHVLAHAGQAYKHCCFAWSRERYGNVVDLIKEHGHKWREYTDV